MCDVEKYKKLYMEFETLNIDDIRQLILNSSTDQEKIFYEMVGNYLLAVRQKDSIERNVF